MPPSESHNEVVDMLRCMAFIEAEEDTRDSAFFAIGTIL
jgi:hypothetical protein